MNIVLAILFFLVVLAFDLYSDYKKWITNRSVDHTFEAWQRGMFLVPSVLAFHMAIPDREIWSILIVPLPIFFYYWFLFDGLYNKLRGYDWWFLGSDDSDDAKLDNLLQAIGKTWGKILKIGGIIISTLLYIQLWF